MKQLMYSNCLQVIGKDSWVTTNPSLKKKELHSISRCLVNKLVILKMAPISTIGMVRRLETPPPWREKAGITHGGRISVSKSLKVSPGRERGDVCWGTERRTWIQW